MAPGTVSPGASAAGHGNGETRSLVLRAWVEPGVSPTLRARVVEISPGRGEQSVVVTTSVDEACRAIRDWLESLEAQSACPER